MTIKRTLLVGIAVIALDASARMPRYNTIFHYPHMLPSPYTLPSGYFVYGTDLAYGLTDFLTVGTSIIRDIYQVYNANAKIALIDEKLFAFSVTGGWQFYNLKDVSSTNPNVDVESWLPGAVLAVKLDDRLGWFMGGNLDIRSVTINEGDQTTGYAQGAQAESDLSWAYGSDETESDEAQTQSIDQGRGLAAKKPYRRARLGNVISVGVSYDFTYKLLGYGISHHWKGFHLGVHYTPGADERKILPIIAGGGGMQF